MAIHRNVGHRPGGGLHSKNVVQQPVRTGTGSRGVREGGAESIGKSYGDHVTHRGDGTGYRGPKFYSGNNPQVKFGNEIAANTTCGPGGSREVLPRGGQGQHGDVAGSRPAPGRGILNNS